MKRRWFLVPLLVGIVALGVTGATVFANGEGNSGDPQSKSFEARVAAILGLDEAKVQSAFTQASKEMQDEAIQKQLDRLVAAGRLTQEQADKARDWYLARPDFPVPGLPFGRFQGPEFRGGHGPFGPKRHGQGPNHGAPQTPAPQPSGATSS